VQSTDEISRLISDWRAGVNDQAQRYDAARRAIDEVSVTETAAGGAIVLTVDSSGVPTDLRLGEDVGRIKPDMVAAEIMNCLRRAQARLADRVGAVVAQTVGDEAGAEAIAEEYHLRFPPPPDAAEVPPPPTAENANFGLSAMEPEPTPPPPAAAPVQTPAKAPQRPPARTDDDENWGALPW
jgi:YbaB/EbfC DNA-binding family protein